MRNFAATFCSTAILIAVLTATTFAEDGFRPLFDGKTLDGWHGDPDCWSVEDGVIVGSTDNKKLKHNTFLATEKIYKNFVIKLKFKLRNHNSGVQVRSRQKPDYAVAGYQADIADKRYMGILYAEGTGRGILCDVEPEEIAKHVNEGDWNQYEITCDGPKIKQVINGHTTVDYTELSDKGATEGIIALQLHTGPKMKVWFKDVVIKELP